MLLSNFRACLALGTLLCALPALSDPPAAPVVAAPTAQTLVLQNVVAGEVLKMMHWDQAAHLPPGVTQIVAPPATNSLTVIASPAGVAEVREIVKLLDIAPRQVHIQMVLAKITSADLKTSGLRVISLPDADLMPGSDVGYATGRSVAQLLQTLNQQGAVLLPLAITTTNDVEGIISIAGDAPVAAQPDVKSFRFAVTPHVNSDDSIALRLHPALSRRAPGTLNPGATTVQDIHILRTVKSGDTLVLTKLFPGAAGRDQLLLFVTPTLVTGENGPASAPKK